MSAVLRLLALALLLAAAPLRAEVALLVHGYMGNAAGWEQSGIIGTLAGAGWQRAGVIVPGMQGPLLPPAAAGARQVYAIELPSGAPLALQAEVLTQALHALRQRHPKEEVTLVGHSAGGVVARMALVRGGAGQVKRLVTIAAPHLGTERALQALDVTHGGGPLNIVKNAFGGRSYHAVKSSWPVLLDLAPAQPGSTLAWLNVQEHPDIEYVSLVRGSSFGLGDLLVPAFSQDLNNVPRLAGRAKSYVVGADHALTAADGLALRQMLQ